MKLLTLKQYEAKLKARKSANFPKLENNVDVNGNKVTITPTIPVTFSLRSQCPIPYDQGQLGSCTANAIAGNIDMIETNKTFSPSRLFIYQNEVLVEDGKLVDDGADDMDGLVYISKNGVCSEITWPYNISKFTTIPPQTAYAEAKNHICTGIISISKDANFINNIKTQISQGHPVLVGIICFPGIQGPTTAKTGIVPMPSPGVQPIGGHEILAVAYDATTITCLNSWGPNWGDKGFCHFPLAYVQAYFNEANLITGFNNTA